MTHYEVITCFSQEGYETYGHKFANSFYKWCGRNTSLVMFSEDPMAGDVLPLHDDEDYVDFMRTYNRAPYIGDPKNPNMQGIKFAHKVFAATCQHSTVRRWRIWMDADVEFTAPIDFSFLEKPIAFLGRPWYRYSECGFWALDMDHPFAWPFLDEMRRYYTSGEVFTLGPNNWHDSHVFDVCRKKFYGSAQQQDLSGHLDPSKVEQRGLHVWPDTVLAKFSAHHKGPRRKQEAYGKSC